MEESERRRGRRPIAARTEAHRLALEVPKPFWDEIVTNSRLLGISYVEYAIRAFSREGEIIEALRASGGEIFHRDETGVETSVRQINDRMIELERKDNTPK